MGWREYYKKHKKEVRLYKKKYRRTYPGGYGNYLRRWFQKVRIEVIKHYCKGKMIRCQCKGCPITHPDLLSIDHIKPIHGKRKYDGWSLWLWLRRSGYPKGFQILCMACNKAKNTNARCPRYGKRH